MPRPGLVIGLGGTGQWVLTWLKRDLLQSNNGVMPQNVRLIAIDTATRLEAGATRVTASGQKEDAYVVGGVSLDDSEFIYIGGDSYPVAQRVREGKLQNIAQWYQAEKWLQTQSPAAFILDDGAGRLRQFGRLAVYKDLLGQKTNSKIWRILWDAIGKIRAHTDEQHQLEIVIIGSLAGGTGSGMLIDIALISRMIAHQLNVHHVLRGYVALQSVFSSRPEDEIKVRTFAAWRELNRFMVVNSECPLPSIEYVENAPEFRIQPTSRLFDVCYLVDNVQGNGRHREATFGVFPMISEAISAVLDKEAGITHTQWVFTNLAPQYARNPETPMYSAVGAFSYQIPIYYSREISTNKLAQNLLLCLLAPQKGPDIDGRLVASGSTRRQYLAASNLNQEEGGVSGRQLCLNLLRQGAHFEGKATHPTAYHARIADFIERTSNNSVRFSAAEELARAGSTSISKNNDGWIGFFSSMQNDPKHQEASKDASFYETYNVLRLYNRRESETEESARTRINSIPKEIISFFGGIAKTGEDDYGLYGKSLRSCMDIHIDIFRQLVQAGLSDILVGRSENVIVAHKGKIGYAWDYFDGLASGFDQFLDFMYDVKRRRDEIRSEFGIPKRIVTAEKSLTETSGKKLFLLLEHPDVKRAEQSYLNVQQQAINFRREDILYYYVVESVRSMKSICIHTRDVLEQWIWHLATGDDATRMPGLWDGLQARLNELKDSYNFDLRAKGVKELVGNIEIQPNDEDLSRALRKWKWVVDFIGEPPVLALKVVILSSEYGDHRVDLIIPSSETAANSKLDIARKNESVLLKLAQEEFLYGTNTSMAVELKKQFAAPQDFAREISKLTRTLFDGVPEASPRSKSYIIQVRTDIGDSYFQGENSLKGALRSYYHLDPERVDEGFGIVVVDAEDPYKLIAVETDDLLRFDHFRSWNICLDAYARYVFEAQRHLDPVLMHNFAGEARAVEFERRMMSEGKAYRPLHPRVVTILEDPIALRQFIYLFTFGMIGEISEDEKYRWQLTWQKNNRVEELWLTEEWGDENKAWRARPDVFGAIQGYVITRKTYNPARIDRVDTDFANELIERQLSARGTRKERDLLKQSLSAESLVGLLRAKAIDPDTLRIVRQDYADLADVLEYIINDRLEILDNIISIKERTTDYYAVTVHVNPHQISVGQKMNLQVELQPTTSRSEDTIVIPRNAESNCFITVEGLQVLGSEASIIHFDPATDHPLPISYELQALLRGTRLIKLQIFTEDPVSGHVQTFQTTTEIEIISPQTVTERQEILPSLNIQVASRPDLVLQVTSDLAADDGIYHLSYVVTSRLPGAQYQNELVGTTILTACDLTVIQGLLLDVIDISHDMPIDDSRERVNSMGSWLFDKVFPAQSASPLRDILQKMGGRVRTLLMLEDGLVWLPWEMIAFPMVWQMSPATWGERYRISRWIRGFGTTLYRELPLGEISLAHYKLLSPGQIEDQDITAWAKVLNAYKSYGIAPVVKHETPVFALHVLHESGNKSQDIVLRPDGSEVRLKSVNDDMDSCRLDLRRKRPVVTISAPPLEHEKNTGNIGGWALQEHSLPFLRAGASAVLGSCWNVSASTDRVFWSAFYDYLGARVPLGDSVWRSRKDLKYLRPDKLDYLAFVCYGDPLARSYLPEPGGGYAALECINPEDPLRPGKTYYFRASLQKRPPMEYADKLIRVDELPEQLNALFLAPGLQKAVPEPVPMQPYGRYMVQATFEVTPSRSGDYPLIVQILDGDEHLKTLQINLKVGDLHRKRGAHG